MAYFSNGLLQETLWPAQMKPSLLVCECVDQYLMSWAKHTLPQEIEQWSNVLLLAVFYCCLSYASLSLIVVSPGLIRFDQVVDTPAPSFARSILMACKHSVSACHSLGLCIHLKGLFIFIVLYGSLGLYKYQQSFVKLTWIGSLCHYRLKGSWWFTPYIRTWAK